MSRSYRAVAPHVDLPAVEHEVLDLWQRNNVFERSLVQTSDGPRWIFYEGPPTANGMPGTHHVEARVFKDVFPRYRTMKGYHVPRRAGWDCHGLPVELAVEKELVSKRLIVPIFTKKLPEHIHIPCIPQEWRSREQPPILDRMAA